MESVEEADKLFKNAFQFFDKDGNGEGRLVEFREVLTRLGDPMGDDEVSLFFKLVDRNNDGKLQYDEFLEMVLEGTSQGTGEEEGTEARGHHGQRRGRAWIAGTGAREGQGRRGDALQRRSAEEDERGRGAVSPPGTVNAKR